MPLQLIIKTKTLEGLAKKTQAMDKEHQYKRNKYKDNLENMAARRDNLSPQTPTITPIGKGVVVPVVTESLVATATNLESVRNKIKSLLRMKEHTLKYSQSITS